MRTALLLLCVLSLTIVPCRAQTSEELAPYPDPTRWEPAIQAFEQEARENPRPADVVMFYGSSSIAGWHGTLSADMGPLPVLGRGFGGSTLWDALHFLDRVVLPVHPAAVVLYEGDNDIGAFGVSPHVVVGLFQRFVYELREELPSTRVFFLSIKPSPSRWESWPAMREANEGIRAICAGDSLLAYVDVATAMLGEDGLPRPDIFLEDRLHMNAKGYELWTTVVREALQVAPSGAGVHR